MPLVDKPDEGNSEQVTQPENQIPEKYRGKSDLDIIQMHQELEKKLGQQAEEIGSLRQLADNTLLQSDSSNEATQEVDFYADPEQAVERIIERKLAPFNQVTQKQQQQAVEQKLNADFPGWKETASASDFQEWVAKSKVRTELWMRADGADIDAASELFGTWSELGNAKSNADTTAEKAVERDRKLRSVATEKGSAGIDPRKILSRKDLIDLKQRNPERYNQLSPDIEKAYAEGRVR